MNVPDLLVLLPVLVIEAPMILLPVVGLVLSRSKLLPRGSASVLATLGFALLLLHAVSQLGFQIFLTRGASQQAIGVIAVFGTALRVVLLAAVVCLSCAIFAGRPRAES